jgi:hypothetical protein
MDLRQLRDGEIDAAFVGSTMAPEAVADEHGWQMRSGDIHCGRVLPHRRAAAHPLRRVGRMDISPSPTRWHAAPGW